MTLRVTSGELLHNDGVQPQRRRSEVTSAMSAGKSCEVSLAYTVLLGECAPLGFRDAPDCSYLASFSSAGPVTD
jgi:hypothetical protein